MFARFVVFLLMLPSFHCFMSSSKSAITFLKRASSSARFAAKPKELPTNPVVVVTGASRGIGRAIALALGEAGCKVVINYASNEAMAKEVCDEIVARGGDKGAMAYSFKANMGNYEEIVDMFKRITTEVGPINVLVNNAGITNDKLSMTMTAKDFTSVIDVNLNGVFFASQQALSSMQSKKVGRIINIASVVGQIGNVGQANYAAAKAGVIGLTRTLAREYGGRNICVNAVCPGFIASDMTKDLDLTPIVDKIPLKRLGQPEDVAGLVRFLALDPAAGYITGHCFNVDGGMAIGAT